MRLSYQGHVRSIRHCDRFDKIPRVCVYMRLTYTDCARQISILIFTDLWWVFERCRAHNEAYIILYRTYLYILHAALRN